MAGPRSAPPAATRPAGPSGPRRLSAHLDGSAWRARLRLSVISAVIISVLWSASAFIFVWRWEETLAQGKLAATARNHFLAVQDGLDEYLSKLTALRALFESSPDVTRAQFATFTGRLLQKETAVQDFSWIPRVARADRAKLEQAAVRDGMAGYVIKTVTADNRVILSPPQDEYLPIFYSTVDIRTAPIYGIDLRSEPDIRERLDRARDKDGLSVVPDFVLHSIGGEVHGFLFSLPVYRHGQPHDTVEARRQNLLGFVHGAFLTGKAFDNIINTATNPTGLDLFLYPAGASPDTLPLHVHASRLRADMIGTMPLAKVLGQPHFTDLIAAGDARWIFAAVPVPGGPLDVRHDRAWLVLAASLLVGAITLFHLHTSGRQARRLLAASEQISALAQTDALTGLMNRRAFNDRLNAAFAASRRGAAPFALLYFDLDHFKDANDTLGHPIGDRLLQAVAGRVAGAMRRTDTLARFGGDEFAVLQSDVSRSAAETVARKINQLLARPFEIDGNEVRVTASIGVALYAPEVPTPDVLMVHADLALYRAKEDGRDCFRFHSEALDIEIRDRVTVAAELRSAIERGEMRLHYQPQVDLASGRLIGVEALVRWQHPQRGLIGPAHFIAIAERTGAIVPLGQWVFEEACRQLDSWHRMGLFPGVVAVNFSAVQLKTHANLDRFIAAALARWRIEPHDIEVELTESVLMEVSQQHGRVIESLERLGIRTAIDDFGTGYSSLSYLTSYPVSRLKIALELVAGINSDSRSATVVRAAVRLAKDLGIGCIAEGVETRAQADFLISAGCEAAQGYLFGAPVSAEDMTRRLREEAPGRRPPPKLTVVAG
ncbi:MAG TPA: EAL domain-containing protein [Xanthobacteraceae bacterium]